MTDLYLRDLVPIVELQAIELKRLMRDKERLNEKIDNLISEIGSLRALQQQDLSLREREQELRSKMQQTIIDLVRRSDRGGGGEPVKPAARPGPKLARASQASAKPAAIEKSGAAIQRPPVKGAKAAVAGRQDRAKVESKTDTAARGSALAGQAKPSAQDPEHMEIPAFLASGPRVGFDRATAEDIREIHGPSRAAGEAPIRKLLARIRARNGAG